MADKALVSNSTLDAIARAIIEKGGATGPMKPGEMAAAIASIPSGGGELEAPAIIEHYYDAGEFSDISLDHLIEGADKYYVVYCNFDIWDGYEQTARYIENAGDGYVIVPIHFENGLRQRIDLDELFGLYGVCREFVVAFSSSTGMYSVSNMIDGKLLYCFLRGTNITLSDMTKKPCQDITYDDDLLVWDFDRGCRSSAKPLWIKRSERTCYAYVSTFDDGTVFRATGPRGHRVFSVDEQRFIYNTEAVGHHVLKDDGTTAILLSTERVAVNDEFYNIITDRHLNCYTDGILTSTHLNNRRTIRGMKFVDEPVEHHDAGCFTGIDPSYVRGLRLCESGETVAALAEYADHCWRARA